MASFLSHCALGTAPAGRTGISNLAPANAHLAFASVELRDFEGRPRLTETFSARD